MSAEKDHNIKKLESHGRISTNYIVEQNTRWGVNIRGIGSVACWVIHVMHLPPRHLFFFSPSFSAPPFKGFTFWCHAVESRSKTSEWRKVPLVTGRRERMTTKSTTNQSLKDVLFCLKYDRKHPSSTSEPLVVTRVKRLRDNVTPKMKLKCTFQLCPSAGVQD